MPCHRRTGQAQPYTCQQPRYTAREKRQRKRWAIYDDDLVMKALFTLLSSPKDRCYSIYRHNRVRGRMTDLSGTAKHSSRKETVWRFLGRVPCWQVTHEFAKRPIFMPAAYSTYYSNSPRGPIFMPAAYSTYYFAVTTCCFFIYFFILRRMGKNKA